MERPRSSVHHRAGRLLTVGVHRLVGKFAGRLARARPGRAGRRGDRTSRARGRADLLAQVAGIFEGASEGELDKPLARQAAHLCRLAGADETLIPQWIADGRPSDRGRPLASA